MNPYLVETLLAPFAGMTDEELVHTYNSIDPNDVSAVKQLIAAVLKPEFDRYDDESQHRIRESFSYFLTVGFHAWESLFEMSMPPIDLPGDPRQFFVWLWEVLFPGEDYLMADPSDTKVLADIAELSNLRARKEVRSS